MIIYKITNTINGKVYIGQTKKSLDDRWKSHMNRYRNNCDYHLYESMRKYGVENFTVEEIDSANNEDDLNYKEMYWISFYNSNSSEFGYNSTPGGESNPMDSECIKVKHKRRMQSEDTRRKISEKMTAIRKEYGFSQETRNKISNKLKGNTHGKGKKRPIDAIEATARKRRIKVVATRVSDGSDTIFDSVKSAALWVKKNTEFESLSLKHIMSKIKKSDVCKVEFAGMLWKYI